VTKLAPKKWGLSDGSSTALFAFFGGVSFLISQGIDLRPNLAVILGLAFADSIFLGGTCLAQISSYWPPYRRRILIHEAGHLLIGIFICFLRTSEVTSYLIPHHYMLPHLTWSLLKKFSLPNGMSNSRGDSRSNSCNANGYPRTGIFLFFLFMI